MTAFLRSFLGAWLGYAAFAVQAAELVSLETRPGIEQRFILIEPEGEPFASAVLFAGGKGALQLSSFLGRPTMKWGMNNFLVRTRDRFAQQGMVVALVDAPTDRQSESGMLGGFRVSAEHLTDIDAVISYLKARTDLPVWLIGTSRGTESATHVAIRSTQGVGGLVLTSSMTVANADGVAVTDMELERIRVPTLIVGHVGDACSKTPPAGAHQIAEQLGNSTAVEVRLFDGGDPPRSKPCRALSQHGFLGIEGDVVEAIADFVRSH
jgi:dienelactone hydrolase